jgi:hypothetical protein
MTLAAAVDFCRYYTGGYCQYGSKCKKVHDASVPSTPCKHFLAGQCKHGDKCAYMHDDIKEAVAETDADQARRMDAADAPEAPEDAEVCRYDPNCYRLNPDHLRQYRHPSREALPPVRKAIAGHESAYDWEAIRRALPTDRTPEQAAERKQLFKCMDFNSNGMISLAELDKCVIESLGMGDVFPKKVLLRAFYHANSVAPANKSLTDDMVTWSEFRYLLCALRRYLQCFEIYDMIDSLGERDGRLETKEIKMAHTLLAAAGLPEDKYENLVERTLKPPMAVMACAVNAKNHKVLFQEFCKDFALRYALGVQGNDGFGRMFNGTRPIKRWGEY